MSDWKITNEQAGALRKFIYTRAAFPSAGHEERAGDASHELYKLLVSTPPVPLATIRTTTPDENTLRELLAGCYERQMRPDRAELCRGGVRDNDICAALNALRRLWSDLHA